MNLESAAWGLVGSATTMLARSATRKAMHRDDGAPRLPRAARFNHDALTFLALAAATGVVFAIADVLQEQRQHTARAEA